MIQNGSGTLTLTGVNNYSGGTAIDTGTLEIGAGATAGSGAITFAGTAAELQLDATQTAFANTLVNVQAGDKVDLAGLSYASGARSSLSGSTLTVTSGSSSEQLTLSSLQTNNVAVTSDGHGGTLLSFGAPATPSAPTDSSDQNGYVNAARDTSAQTLSGVVLAGSSVKVYNNGIAIASVSSNPSTGVWSYQIGQLSDGQYSYTVSASNSYGASAQSTALNFSVATQAPSAQRDGKRRRRHHQHVRDHHGLGGGRSGGQQCHRQRSDRRQWRRHRRCDTQQWHLDLHRQQLDGWRA